ncbi:MAG: peptidylprolyl isomerase [Pseudomonadota bacterium]
MKTLGMALSIGALCASVVACDTTNPGTATTTGGTGTTKGTTLAKVGPTVITVEDFEAKLNQQSPFIRSRYADLEKRREYLDNQIRFELLALEAQRRGLDKDPEVADSIRKIMVQKLTREEFDNRVKLEDITDAEIQKAFDDNADDYHKPEMVRVSHIFFAGGQDKAAARKQADTVLKQLKAKPDDRMLFRTLAQEHSADETTKATGGDLRYLSKEQYAEKYGPVVAEAVFALAQLNQLSDVVEGQEGYHIFKQTGRRQAIERTLDQVCTQIRNRLYRDKRTEAFNVFVENLKKQAGVTIDDAKLAAIQIASAQPPHGMGSPTTEPMAPPAGSPTGVAGEQVPSAPAQPDGEE